MPSQRPATSTQQDSTYDRLRQWLGLGRFLPGERLKIRQVAAELGVGVMPVRAALQRLSAEGALVNSPNCGVAVPRLSRAEFDEFNAEKRFDVADIHAEESPLCIAGEILQGLKKPHHCPAFGKQCTPENPLGATMVSSEGACAAYYKYKR